MPPPFPVTDPAAGDWASILDSPRAPAVATDPDALAALNYTGGTTGMPKGCEHTQWHMVYTAAAATVGGGRRVGETTVVLNYLPVFWIAGEVFGILNPLVNGGSVVLMTRWDADAALALVERHGVTSTVGTVDNYVELMDAPGFDGNRAATLDNAMAVSFVLKLDPAIRRRWRDATGHTLREASYGMTETNTADTFTLGFQDGDFDLASEPVFCGLPVPGTDILIVDEAGAPVPLGETGQIVVRSPSVTTGYYRNAEATADAFQGDWLRTGDVGRFDERGALHYLARNKEMIKTNGMSVFPAEVEALLRMHPGGRDGRGGPQVRSGQRAGRVCVRPAGPRRDRHGRRTHGVGAREHGGLQGADRRTRRGDAHDGHRQDPQRRSVCAGGGESLGSGVPGRRVTHPNRLQ